MRATGKLVRDRIPQIIRDNGESCETAIMTEQEYTDALRAKLVEEAREAAAALGNDLIAELADLYEVIDALLVNQHIALATVRAERRRRADRGGFERRVRLLLP